MEQYQLHNVAIFWSELDKVKVTKQVKFMNSLFVDLLVLTIRVVFHGSIITRHLSRREYAQVQLPSRKVEASHFPYSRSVQMPAVHGTTYLSLVSNLIHYDSHFAFTPPPPPSTAGPLDSGIDQIIDSSMLCFTLFCIWGGGGKVTLSKQDYQATF